MIKTKMRYTNFTIVKFVGANCQVIQPTGQKLLVVDEQTKLN